MQWLNALLTPPVFDDPHITFNARLLHPILIATATLLLVTMPLIMLFSPGLTGRLALGAFPVFLASLGLLWLERRGRVRLASDLLLAVTWLSITALVVSGTGVNAPAFLSGYLTIIVMAGLLRGGRASILIAAGSMAVGLLLLIAEAQQVWSPAPTLPSPAVWGIAVFLFWLVVAVQHLSARTRREALAQAQTELAERQRAEAALQRSDDIYRQAIMAAGAVPYYRDQRTNTYTFMGDGIRLMTGYFASEMTPVLFDSLIEEGLPRGALAHLSFAEANQLSDDDDSQPWECDYRIRTRDGQTRWLADVSVRGLNHQGRWEGAIGILQDITDRKQAEERAHSTVSGLRAVVEVADELLHAPDLDTFCRRAVELGREKLGLERCGLFLIDETQTYLLGTYGTDAQGQTTDEHGAREPLALKAALFQSYDQPWKVVSSEWGYWDGDQPHEFGSGWVVGTVIRSVRGPIGLLYNDAAITRAPLNVVLQETVAVYGSVLGNILERKRAERAVRQLNLQLEQRAAQLATLNEIGRTVSTLQNLENVFESIYTRLSAALPVDALLICLYDAATNELSYPFAIDEGQRTREENSKKRPGTFLDRVITTGESLLINRTPEQITEITAQFQAEATGHFGAKRASASLMYVPMIALSRTIGLMSVQSYTLNAFDDNSLAFLKGVALQAAIAIENARLFEAQQHELAERIRAEAEARRQLNELSVLHAIGKAAAAAAHEDELLAQVVPLIGDRLYPDIIGVLLVDPATGALSVHPASRGMRPEQWPESVPAGTGLIGQVASRGQARRIPDVQLEPAYLPFHPGIRSEMCVPLKAGERVIGVINLESERVAGFSEADERLLGTIAGQLASAIEHLRAQAKIRQLNIALEQRVQERTAQLEEANRELESFSYSVSHDLRTPLRGIDGFARILLEDHAQRLEADGQRYLQRVRANAQRMGQLIDDLLEFSRLGRRALTLQTLDTTALVRTAWTELLGEQAQRQIDIVIGALPDCQADRALLKQVWVNLLSNALKYTRGREQARVEVGWTGEAYFVRDNGAGFDMRYADKLFGVFQRLHRQDEFEGTGVGLAHVKRIVERHGGRIWATAEVDQGATFYFTLVPPGDPTRIAG